MARKLARVILEWVLLECFMSSLSLSMASTLCSNSDLSKITAIKGYHRVLQIRGSYTEMFSDFSAFATNSISKPGEYFDKIVLKMPYIDYN